MAHSFPGFNEAVAQEQRERTGAYLDLPSVICGIEIRQMTPMDLARLTYAGNPYVTGYGEKSYPVAAHFIFQLAIKPFKTPAKALLAIAGNSIEEIDNQIEDYVELTFRDQNSGGGATEDAPIASLIAWLEYRMFKTFGWDRERTLNAPLRLIWQQVRCWQRESGEIVKNKLSGAKNDEFLDEVKRRMDTGEITQKEIDKINEGSIRLKFGDAAVDAMNARTQSN